MNIIYKRFRVVALMGLTVVALIFSPTYVFARKISIGVNEAVSFASVKAELPKRGILISLANPWIQRFGEHSHTSNSPTMTITRSDERSTAQVELTIDRSPRERTTIATDVNTHEPNEIPRLTTPVVVPISEHNSEIHTPIDSSNNDHGAVNTFSRGAVSLTFDDGYQSGYTKAAPILEQANLNATFYIISKFINSPPYMTGEQVLALEDTGNEIGAHSRTHPHFFSSGDEIVFDEIHGAKQDLLDMGVSSVTTFAYPFGEYTRFSENEIRNAGYRGVRTSDDGAVETGENPYALEAQTLVNETSFEHVKGWIDEAVQRGHWQILIFHKIDDTGERYSTSPKLLQQIVDYLASTQVPVVTVDQGIQMMYGTK